MPDPTVADLFDMYLRHLERRKRKSNTIRCYRSAYNRASNDIGAIPVASLTLSDLVWLHEDWADTPVLADRAISYISAALTHAERLEIRKLGSNPCRLIERYNTKPELVAVDRETLLKLLEAIDYLAPAEEIDGVCAELFRLLVYTGARLSEIRSCRWDYVDLEEGVLRLPDSKTGAKEIALCEEAARIFRRMPRVSPWCFPGRDPQRPRVRVRTAWSRIVEWIDVPSLRRHDIRRGFATALWHAGVSRSEIGELLGHADPRTTRRYTDPRVSRLAPVVDRVLSEAG